MDFYNIIQKFHSGWAYLVLLFLFIAIVNSFVGHSKKRVFTAKDRKIALLGLVSTHIMFVVGMILYFVSPLGLDSLGEMKIADIRLTSLEHPLINLIGIILITVGWSKHKRVGVALKFKQIYVFYGLGLLLILLRIPWKAWFS
ncbi:MAG: hypothetical protein RBR78_04265 [Flavobacteriaceae bacterium]|jgi:hypothetical protein|nr:hypothetical protein [Flavobacteriaceae bacterium]